VLQLDHLWNSFLELFRLNFFWKFYLGLGLAFTALELYRPARKLRYWRWDAIPFDLIACAAQQFVFFSVASRITNPLSRHLPIPVELYEIPLSVRVVLYYVLTDCGAYWIHRLIHTRHLWRFHRFHHSATQLYWLAGVRTTIQQQALANLPFTLLLPLLAGAPPSVFDGLLIAGILTNHWMHTNLCWRSNWLEWVLVTPRSHQVHHSVDPTQHHGNYGVVLGIWDRLFGTFVPPDKVTVREFGIGDDRPDMVQLMAGI
jgi:sterol desaturase/sphingolipid hydroxylase (fatty acid hydroxylase superfamily)